MTRSQITNFRNSAARYFPPAALLLHRLQAGRARMIESDSPQSWSNLTMMSRYAAAVMSVAVAIVAAEPITRLLNAEAIASAMVFAVIFAAWGGGFWPGAFGVYPRPSGLSYLPRPSNQLLHLEE